MRGGEHMSRSGADLALISANRLWLQANPRDKIEALCFTHASKIRTSSPFEKTQFSEIKHI